MLSKICAKEIDSKLKHKKIAKSNSINYIFFHFFYFPKHKNTSTNQFLFFNHFVMIIRRNLSSNSNIHHCSSTRLKIVADPWIHQSQFHDFLLYTFYLIIPAFLHLLNPRLFCFLQLQTFFRWLSLLL